MTSVSVEVDAELLDQARAAIGGGSDHEVVVHAMESLITVVKASAADQE